MKKTRKIKKRFLYNPDNPKKSFDVYIDKNPKDTINIKYTTVNDVKKTIKKLEKLYKTKKYKLYFLKIFTNNNLNPNCGSSLVTKIGNKSPAFVSIFSCNQNPVLKRITANA